MRSFSTLVAAAALSLFAMPAWSAGDQDFTLVNRTGYTIEQVYVSPIKAKDWQEDVLGRDVLDDGESVDITFNKREEVCRWDLKVVYDDGEEAARAMGAAIVGCEEMQAIRLVLNHLAIRCAMEAGAPTRDVMRLLGLQEVVIEWVMSVHEDPS